MAHPIATRSSFIHTRRHSTGRGQTTHQGRTIGASIMIKYKLNSSKESGRCEMQGTASRPDAQQSWQVIFNKKTLAPVITPLPHGFFAVSQDGVQWPGRYADRHYAARDILRKAGLMREDDNEWMGACRILSSERHADSSAGRSQVGG